MIFNKAEENWCDFKLMDIYSDLHRPCPVCIIHTKNIRDLKSASWRSTKSGFCRFRRSNVKSEP